MQYRASKKLPVKKEKKKKVNYRLLSGFLVTFTTAFTIVGKVSFDMPWCTHKGKLALTLRPGRLFGISLPFLGGVYP